MKLLNPELDNEELKYMFIEFDTDGSGTIEFEELQRQLELRGIRTKSLRLNNVTKKPTVNFVEE
jgi:Ca2+-binding EF-hand superfamily protein